MGTFGGGTTTATGGRAAATDCGVIMRGAGFGGSTGATGAALAAGTAGFGGTDFAGTAAAGGTVCRRGGGAAGRAGVAGWTALCVIAFSTSPGLEMCERSILGLNSSTTGAREPPRVVPGSPCSW